MTYAFAAAGTGGHVFPALAVADALVASGVDPNEIVFFGGDRMEAKTVPAAGYDFVPVELRGLKRSLSLQNLGIPRVVWNARSEMRDEMQQRATKACIVFGGYVSVPAAMAARKVGASLFVQEQNAKAGLANRFVARWADRVFVGFTAARSQLKKAEFTGNPLRPVFAQFDREAMRDEARDRYGIPDERPVLGVLGGSLGAKILNEVAEALALSMEPDHLAIVHLTGRAHHAEIEEKAERAAIVWRPVAFEDRMEQFYAASDLVLSRAGALTINELAATGTPAVVVPLGLGTNQAANALELEAAGGLVQIPQTQIDQVPIVIDQLIMDRARRTAMGTVMASHGRPAAARVIAAALREAVDG
ncbi:MAG: UDP-N-acetylglucosamine--N-acetylmuramyl-(pentapeptide) pyrophosphoryl-undecaprenol N-acetylglucosamine transferase [Acidimicrobiia bacterium]|nr:UDP-N-acetylglucosamine--N-acetylmuramyl-(pentapeptide) pyrophosphoryl-undecaprenol N-acetylglucosamine transferase [Acidimicrobiia bacterium]